MKIKKQQILIPIILVFILAGFFNVNATTETKELNYNESTEEINNPERGFYRTNGLKLNPSGNRATTDGKDKFIYLCVDISAFSGAINGDKDLELTEDALNALENTLNNEKNQNNSVILRFVYDQYSDGIQSNEGIQDGNLRRVEPSIDMIKKHISQMKDIFTKYSTTIYTIQMGFFGAYGELHSTSMCTTENFNATIDCLLENTPDNIPISVRTPGQYANWVGVNIDEINKNITTKGSKAYRVGMFNDGYLGSYSDLGSFPDRNKAVEWLNNQANHTPYGGEAVINYDDNAKVDGYKYLEKYSLMDNLEPEIFKTHTSYLNYEWNQNLHSDWKLRTYNGINKVYKDAKKTDYEYIQDHLGYRYVIREEKLDNIAKKNSKVHGQITIENVGFAPMIKDKVSRILLVDENNKITYTENLNMDIKDFKSNESITKDYEFSIPTDVNKGKYKVYLQVASEFNQDKTYLNVKFANKDIWNDQVQANYLGNIEVIENTDDDVTNKTKTENNVINNTVIEDVKNTNNIVKQTEETKPTSVQNTLNTITNITNTTITINTTNQTNNTNKNVVTNQITTDKDTTLAKKSIPQTGEKESSTLLIIGIVAIASLLVALIIKYRSVK